MSQENTQAPAQSVSSISAPAVLVTVFVIGTCGLIYELLAGTLASYVLGDSVTQFSTIIGVYLFAMGVGAWLSGFITKNVVARFVEIEIAVGLVGGCSAAVLFLAFSKVSFFAVILYGMVLLIGILVGLEIPLLMRILKHHYDLKDLVSRVLTVDYLGALLASLAFPLFIVPKLGLVRGSFFVGIINAVVALWCTYLLASALPRPRQVLFLRFEAILSLLILVAGLIFSKQLTSLAEDALFSDPIVFAKSSPYQRVVVTRGRNSFQLYINGHLQFTSADEHRYHEALVHPPMSVHAQHNQGNYAGRVLVMGGGDGLAVREILRYPTVESVTLVDLDPMITGLAQKNSFFVQQNKGSLNDARIRIVNDDAMIWLKKSLEEGLEPFDVVIIDFPDPNSFSLGKLYTSRFYRLLRRALHENSSVVVQATSPMYARKAFWCVAQTMESVGFSVRAYHAPVPSFGEWGYILASPQPFTVPERLAVGLKLKFLTAKVMQTLFEFPKDMAALRPGVNRLNNQILVRMYEEEWSRWN